MRRGIKKEYVWWVWIGANETALITSLPGNYEGRKKNLCWWQGDRRLTFVFFFFSFFQNFIKTSEARRANQLPLFFSLIFDASERKVFHVFQLTSLAMLLLLLLRVKIRRAQNTSLQVSPSLSIYLFYEEQYIIIQSMEIKKKREGIFPRDQERNIVRRNILTFHSVQSSFTLSVWLDLTNLVLFFYFMAFKKRYTYIHEK